MSAEIERPSRPRLTFPYWLALLLFLGTLASAILVGGPFVLSPDYREHRLIFGSATLAVALLLWLWVLGATRRFRRRDFTGPIQTVRGADSPFQPITALVFLAVAAYLAYGVTIPVIGHALADQRTVSVDFRPTGAPQTARRGCAMTPTTQEVFGPATLCVPEALIANGAAPARLRVTGRRSDFGFWPVRIEIANPEGPVRKVAPLKETSG